MLCRAFFIPCGSQSHIKGAMAMKTTITGKNMVVTPGITERIMKKTNRMERYLKPDTEMFVRLSKERSSRRIAEITVPFEGVILRAEASAEDNLFLAIDQALAKLEKQIHRYRTKLEKRLREDAFKSTEMEYIEDAVTGPQEERILVRTKQFPVRPMSVEDATLQMELLGHAFFVFVNNETERTNVLYLRKDGNLGLLEPEN
jgi:putative sigma-54 modulation protein